MTKIILNDTLEVIEPRQFYMGSVDNNLINIATKSKKLNLMKCEKYYKPYDTTSVPNPLPNTGIFGLLHHAYNYHLDVKINPHDVWNIIFAQIVQIVANNAEAFRGLFTESEGKEEITVMSNSLHEMPMNVLCNAVAAKVKMSAEDVADFFPKFSTSTPLIEEMYQAMFCDMASPYYEYSMTMCGIRSITVGGEVDDWRKILTSIFYTFRHLNREIMDKPEHIKLHKQLLAYVTDISFLASRFMVALEHEMTVSWLEIWKGIYTECNGGSGVGLTIDGWFKDLYFYQPEKPKLVNFVSDHACVFYKQKQTNTDYAVVYGGFGYDVVDGVYSLEYSKHYMKLVDNDTQGYKNYIERQSKRI